MMTNEEIRKHLDVLKIQNNINDVTLKDVTLAFRQLALILHPDKAGNESTAAFQELINAYEKVFDFFKEKHGADFDKIFENDDDQKFFKDNFQKFNFPFENKGSFTVSIEDYLADTWQECIEILLGEPKIVKNAWGTECDRIWKVEHGKIDITLHIYNKPKNKKGSKLMLQGSNQSLICSYVFEELPKMYKLVCDNKPKPLEDKNKTKMTPSKPAVKWEQCKFKSSLMQMKMHMKSVHGTRPRRNSKRLRNFSPIIKSSKRCKNEKSLKMDLMINSEGIIDEENSYLLVDDTFSGKETLLEECTKAEENIEETSRRGKHY